MERRRYRTTSQSRNQLMNIRRLFKQVVLETWKRDVEAIFRENEGVEWMTKLKAMPKIMGVLDRLLR